MPDADGCEKRRSSCAKLLDRHMYPISSRSSPARHQSALELSAVLLEEGFKVLPIRTPTVPPGTERLRFSLSLDIKDDDIVRLVNSKILLSCR